MKGPWQDLFIFFGLVVLLFFAWAATGGPERAENRSPSGISTRSSTSSTSGGGASIDRDLRDAKREVKDIEERLEELKIEGVASPYRNLVAFAGGAPKKSLSSEEYIRIRTSGKIETPINITGWRVESLITGNSVVIPGASPFPKQNSVNSQPPLSLGPSQTVFLQSGRSPIGISFRDNMCAGYLDPRDRFNPRLKKQCPDPEKEFEGFSDIVPTKVRDEKYDECKQFIDRYIDRCEVTRIHLDENDDDISELPLTNACIAFIENDLTYDGCVANHQNDPNFFDKEWRVFFGTGVGELWREKDEVLRLLDRQGLVVDVWQY